MRKILDRLTALVMVMLMVIQTITPAITSFAKEEELDKRYVIQKLETLKQDTYANFSLNLATVIDDKNLDTDTNVKFVLNTTNVNSNIKLLVRKDFSLYDERTFDTVEEAHKEFDRVDKSLKDQGLSLDVSVVQEDGKYRIHNNYVPQADKEDFGDDYKVYSLKVVDEFDFDKEGLFNKLPEDLKSTEQHRLQLAEERRLQQDGEVPEGDKHNRTYIFDFKVDKAVDSKLTTIALNKDDNNPLEVKQSADLFAAILDDKTYSTYQTEQLPAEVTSSIEHKKEVAKAKAEADAKAKAEADAKAKAEAEEKAKKEAEEKAKADAKAKEEADAKAKEEADAKAKEEAEKIKAEEAKKTEEQKALEEKAKAEKDAKAKQEADAKAKAEAEKLKAEAEVKQKAEAEEKAKQEELAKKQAEAEAKRAAEEKAKKDLENKKLLGLVQGSEEDQEEEPIIKKKETTEEVKKEPATPEERKQKAEEFDKALQDKKEDIKKSEDKKDANNKEDNKKTTDKKEVSKETKGLLEGIKEFFGLTNLQKADRELKAILSVKANGLKEVQALLSSFEEKYHLTKEEQAKLMDDNKDAIKALIEKDADKNFNPHVFADTGTNTETNTLNLDGKKFTVRTIFRTSNIGGPIQPTQFFKIHLDKKLKVNDPKTLKPIEYNGKVIARPTYTEGDNTITYNIEGTIPENVNIPLEIPVDYDTTSIQLDADGTFTVVNRVSGLGVVDPKPLLPEQIDKNGNPAGTIIEPGRHDVIQIFDDENNRNYSVNIDAEGTPIVEQGELLGFNWAVKVHSTDNLKDLGFKLNLTAVKGSGLKEIQNVMINGKSVELTDQLEGDFGIVDSKHHDLKDNTKDITYTFFTPKDRVQSSYMLDISGVLTNKNNKLGAARIVLDEGHELDAISEATSTRVGMNNRTTIQGKFDTKDKATWTVTDGVSSGDEAEQNKIQGLPLETRSLGGKQTPRSANRAVYGIDLSTGQMVVKEAEKAISPVAIPKKAADPKGPQAVGNIAVYEFGTDLTDAAQDEKTAKDYSLGGVSISKYKDIVVEQIWNLPNGGKMPAQTIEVKEKGTDNVVASIPVGEEEGNTRLIRIPDVKFWDFEDGRVYIAKKLYIDQNLPTDQVSIGKKNYKYYENANYYQEDIKVYQIRNAAIESTEGKPGSFKIVKIDKNKDEKGNTKKLAGAKFSLLGANVEVTTDKNGEATFTNIKPGSYTLRETKAPSGYKLDQDIKYVTIDSNGNVIIKGNNVDFSTGTGASGIVEHNNAPNWPDFMNTMHYSTVDRNGNSVLYVYLKPRANYAGGSTNKDTVFNISLPGVNLRDANVDVYNIYPSYRNYYRSALEDGTIENMNLGTDVINQYSRYSQTITGKSTQNGGYQIDFPSSRFDGDWGFMVKVTANLGTKESETLNYKWQVDGNPKDSRIIQDVTLSKTKQTKGVPTLTITNEAFKKSEIEVTKFANSFSEVEKNGKKTQKRERLPGAEFVLKDSEGNLIANKVTDANGHVSFGEFPPGVYRLEEVSAPDGYQKSNVYFEVTVNDSQEVTYVAKFLSGSGQPVVGVDYWIEKGEETQTNKKANVTSVNQRLEYNENKEGSWGTKTNVWEAYMFESLKYHADITLDNVSPGSRFEIQFDPNLDFTQYFSDFPKIRKDGKDIADPYFDYNTKLLTYVFNENSKSYATTTVTIDLIGMIPDKYNFQNSGTKNFSVTVAPGTDKANTITEPINADYGRYDTGTGQPSQSYYFRDIYKGDDGEWYVTAMAYFNPLAYSRATKTLQFNWMSVNYDKNTRIARQQGDGYRPAYDLVDVKVYEAEPNMGTVDIPEEGYRINYNMPLSYGIRPEQDPNTYTLLYSTRISPNNRTKTSQNGVTLEYDPSKISTSGGIHTSYPLKVKLPPISAKMEGYIIEQTFKITNMKNFINLSRLFYMNNGGYSREGGLESAFINSANFNTASADQTGVEIPQYYKEVVGLINRQYTPGKFKITKLNQANNKEKLPGAIFVLRPENGKPIYRTSNSNGEVSFEGLAPGRYVLDEFRAPRGFQKTDKQWQVIVFNDGNVRITESSITGSDQVYQGNEKNIINIEVTNKPEGQDFVVYKKDGNGQPLAGAKFELTKYNDNTFTPKEATSDLNGLVKFGELQNGTYIIEEITPPETYKKLDKKWVLVIDDDGKRVYNYREKPTEDKNKDNLLSGANTKWINVKDRSQYGWGYNDNRTTGWVANSTRPFKLGTRIVAINKENNYVIQRYVINPEAASIKATTATIHREKPQDPNMSWYAGTEEYKVYKLTKAVTGYISDMRLDDLGATDITSSVSKSAQSVDGKYGEPQRLKLSFSATDKPIVIDVKIPYTNEDGGVGTGMDWTEDGTTYWKSDFYERVDLIKEAGLVNPPIGEGETSIIGAYISEDSLDVTNELKTFGFKIKKVNDDKTNPKVVPGAKFKLTNTNTKEEIERTSNNEGILSFDKLKPGFYTLEETEPAPGYEKSNTTWTVRIADDGKVYIKDNKTQQAGTETNAAMSVVHAASSSSANRIKQNLANNSSSLYGVNTGLEFGPEMVAAALRAGNAVTYDILGTTTNKQTKQVKTSTNAKYLGNDEFLVRIDVKGNVNIDCPDVTFDLQLHDDVTFVPNSTITWKENANDKNQVPNNPSRWHTGYDPNTKTIGVRGGAISINKGDTASIEFKVKMKSNLNVGQTGFIINSLKVYNTDCDKLRAKKFDAYTIHQNAQNGTVITDPLNYQRNGQDVTFTAKPNPGYKLVGNVTVTNNKTGRGVPIRNGNTFTMPASDVTINARFEAETYNITYNKPTGGTVSGPAKSKTGETVTVTATPETGYKFEKLIVTGANGQSVATNGNSFVMPAGNVRVSAQFTKSSYTIGYQSTQHGKVELPKTANPGDVVTITATPDDGYMVDTISVNSGQGKVEVTGNTFVMPKSNVVVNVTFKLKPADKYNVTVSQTTNGSVSAEPTSQEAGKTVNLTVKPEQGYKLEKLSVKDASGNDVSVNNNSFTMPKADVTVSATFKKESASIEEGPIKINPYIKNGKITIDPKNPNPGEKVTITVRPNPGYKLNELIVKNSNGEPIKISPLNETNRLSIALNRIGKLESQSIPMNSQAMSTRSVEKSLGKSESENFVSLASADQATNFGQGEKENGLELSEKIVNDPVGAGESSESKYTFIMPASPGNSNNPDSINISASFASTAQEGEKEIKAGEAAQITNKQVGLDFKVFKSDIRQRPLEGAEFELFKADEKYNITEENDEKGKPIASIRGVSGEDGNVKFVDKDNHPAKLQPGYYVMREKKSPQGYKNITADWKIRVYEKDGILKAEYKGPKDTPSSYLSSKSANDTNTMDAQGKIVLKDAGNGIKYASRINYIDTNSKTFVQRIYIDTRGYTGNEKVNVDITPVVKREEIDTPGARPETTKEGVKTAYRTTYKIGSPYTNTDVKNGNYEQILRFYDLADDNVSMINTARWRPFDWGFDEDQLNLDKGVYFIDVEGFYDDNITKEDIGKIEMNVKFQTERYFYSLAKDKYGNFYWEKDGSYQAGAAALGGVYKEDVKDPVTGKIIHKKGDPTEWGKKLSTDNKYPNWIGKEVVWTNGQIYKTGMIAPPGRGRNVELGTVTTSVDISSLYTADGVNQIGQDGMDIINDEETYNITFSKHGQDSSKEDINSQAVTERRLEGGIFKLQEEVAPNIYRDLPESTVASAFNGFFGFRGLSPGRYRLLEVQPPKGYKPITDPLLYFTVQTIKTNSGKIVHPETGQIVDIKSIKIKFSDDDKEAHKLEDLQMVNKKGETVNIKDVKSTDINVETTKIINPHTKTEVLLKDLKIVGENGTYDIAQAKIVPGSSGYISLEYDRANGVYQYVPEKSTSEKNGKLVDFVTSATAKNMGKIINTKPGDGEVTVSKVDQSGNTIAGTKLRPGAQFRLINRLTGDVVATKTVGADGTIKFDKLPIGQYQLEEITPPDGYINTKQIWNFTVGGEGLDPYSGPAPQRREDLSDKITLESTMKVVNPDTENHTPKAKGEIHPHLGEAFEFDNKFKIKEGTKINPGDYFTIKLSDNIDLNGIFENKIDGLDILADGIGTVAKADYNRYAGTITYTFTDYANTYTLTNFSNKLSAFINLDKVQNSDIGWSMQTVGLSLGNNTKSEKVKVVYDSMTARNAYDYQNLGSKITKFNPETGEFVHYYYINRDQTPVTGPMRFVYSSEQNIENLKISSYALFNWSEPDLKRVMPESFGVNEYDPYLPRITNLISSQKLNAYVPATINYRNGIGAKESYIIKVTGRVADKNKMAYVGHGKLESLSGYLRYVNRHDEVRKFVNSATADGKLEIQAVNPENKIKFKKVDQNNKPLSGAQFTLYIQNSEGTWDVYSDNGVQTSGDDGLVEFSKLKPGKYKIEETKAPEGYDKIAGPILEFEVDASGKIIRDKLKSEVPKIKTPDGTGTTGNTQSAKVEEPGIEPIPVVNKKKQEISFKKVDATDDSITLEGAEFEVWHKLEKGDEYSKLNIYEKTTDGKTERLALRGDAPQGYKAVKDNKLTSDKDGLVKFGFYDSGYYALKEIKAPKGYIAPKEYVREFVVVDGKIQESVYKTEMEVDKTISSYDVSGTKKDVYNTDITLTINSDHEPITYTKDKSKITLSGLPYDNDLAVNNTDVSKQGIYIYAKLIDKKNSSSPSKYYPVNLKNYTNNKGSIEIDLYALVSQLEGKTDDSITSENTIELSMFSTLALSTELNINSKIEIGDGEDKISEERTFHIGTKEDQKVNHSYTFTNLGEPKLPIPIENKKGEYPLTGAMGIIGFLVVGAVIMTTAYYKYRRKRRESALS
ncbi:MAG: fibrinogen-binding adhesin SdrG C-terminal domain-containing protein [Finegoldia magna]|nr:SpaA isopeptide-forming pilin-related protein [Finegoldia magna]MBS5942031.1 fibrinogen-binding adhesin SdrG C-terminal domain-containing protein [Finegoldia magna]